jgi:hypothetical protein
MNSSLQSILRGLACALLSAVALSADLLQGLHPFPWAPGVAFALVVVTARSRSPLLLAAVALSYTLGYSCGDLLEPLGTWPMRVGVVAIGSAALASSLRWKGGLDSRSAATLFAVGTALSLPFWLILGSPPAGGAPPLHYWVAGFCVWQVPVAWLCLRLPPR